jgi:alpha-pyrone synthase
MNTAITAIGIANPRYKQHQHTAADIVTTALQLKPAEKRLLKSLYRSTGIEYRHSVLSDFCRQPGEYDFFPNDPQLPFPTTAARMRVYKEHALPLALQAIQCCVDSLSSFNKNTITHLITVSCTGMYAPGIDIEIVQQLQLNSTVKRTCINFMGCYGAFNAIKVADAICQSDPRAKVLVVSVELCTIHFQKNNSMDSMISNAIFADGAAAVLIEATPTQQKCFLLKGFYCDLLPQHSQDMAWHIADDGFDIVLSSYVPQAIQSGIAEFTQRLLVQHHMALADIDLYAIHPGGYKILKACEEALSISEEDNKYSYEVLRQYGNMSSATTLFVLKKIWDDLCADHHHNQIFSCAFGPGLTLESMLLRISVN